MNAKFSLMVLIVSTLIDIGMIFCILHVAGRENFILAGFAISILMFGIISVAWIVGCDINVIISFFRSN